ncbi:MAG: transposase [Chloroflexi bacterium]|nr:transposase [Chloroflexota bacterium]
MKYDPDLQRRRSIRLKGYDYSQSGAYFVTICVQDRTCLFGEVINGEMRLNEWGQVVQAAWQDLPNHLSHVQLDEFVVMPNHVHGIIMITDDADHVGAGSKPTLRAGSKPTPRAGLEPAPTTTTTVCTDADTRKRHGLPEIVRQFKTFSARRINECRHTPGSPVWQRNYYEHVIRDEEDLQRIRQYIVDNPANWAKDEDNPNLWRGNRGGSMR